MGIRVDVNGRLGLGGDRLLSPLDHGFLFGASVYETIRTYGGRPFLLDRHLRRLRESAEGLRIDLALSDEEIAERIARALAAADNPESSIRLIASVGEGEIDYRLGAARQPTFVVIVRPLPEVPPRVLEEGLRVAVVSVMKSDPRSVDPRIKSSNLLNHLLAMREAQELGGQEAILLNHRGEVAEGTQSNVFLVKEGAVKTPPLEAGILAGITREIVIELAGERGFPVEESAVLPEELFEADEVFLTATGKEILPVTSVNGTVVGSGKPGPVSRRLLEAYREKVRSLL